ncbi:unnamed protein product [Callosobruchus maculatus]|uniref:Regulatory protein zeste n=1 Tax=Callosobruchus maculatus TaxID=64391 RepID=A0A653C290_CALMS|nr:unnamed protein product [Callosobruchus maculatus]
MEKVESDKRKRSANYTGREKELLISLVAKFKHIIENKKTNAVFNKQKADQWERIADEYNASQTSGLRNGLQLRSLYEQMKKIAKQHKAEDKVEVVKTGGGVFAPKITPQDEKILAIIKENYFTINNPFDSNSVVSDAKDENFPETITISVDQPEEQIIHEGSMEENIFVYYDNEASSSKTNSIPQSTINIPEKIPETTVGKRKRKASKNVDTDYKLQLYKQKLRVLNIVEEAEKENLKGKKLDNEIKLIIKQQECLKLEILKQQNVSQTKTHF